VSLALLLAAFTGGLLGSAHCGVMCGGIASAFAMQGRGTAHAVLNSLGRIGSYALAGALAGMLAGGFGAGAGWLLGWQDWAAGLRLATGIVLALIGLQVFTGIRLMRPLEAGGARLWRQVVPLTRRVAAKRSAGAAFMLGMLWGWMPCGLVYSMLLAAALSGSGLQASAMMLAFGLGTTPAVLALGLGGQSLRNRLQARGARRFAGGLVLALGAWTVAAALTAWPLAGSLYCHAIS
jgi:sulfite exporter TauE/SafE